MNCDMAKKGWLLTAFFLLCLCVELAAFGSPVWAQDHTLYRIDRSWEEEETHFEFTLGEEMPEYEVKTSGQRVDVIFFQTGMAETLEKLNAGGELVRTLLAEQGGRTIVSLVLRRPPKDVEYSTSQDGPILRLKMDLPEEGSRPSIASELSGRLSVSRGGVSMTHGVSSSYRGNWKAFFRDYELPLRIKPELVYTLPPFPGLLPSQDLQALPQRVVDLAEEGKWGEARSVLAQTDLDSDSDRSHLVQGIVLADLLLRQDKNEQARETMRGLTETRGQEHAAILGYLRAYAAAAAGDAYLGFSRIRSLDLPEGAPQRWQDYARLLEIETALGSGHKERAYALASDPPKEELPQGRIFALRRAQAGFVLGKREWAAKELNSFSSTFLQRYPLALAQLARSSYENEDYGKALQLFSRLANTLSDPELSAMARFGEAMADLQRGARVTAKDDLAQLVEDLGNTRAKWRAKTELADLAVLDGEDGRARDWAKSYRDIALSADNRKIREEAAFKRILVAYLSDHSHTAVKWLGSFLRDYHAGELRHQARALLVEVLPGVVKDLIDEDSFVRAMGLVQEHAEVLRYSRLSLDFLYDLGGAFYRYGFFKRASRVYEYMMSLAEDSEEKEDIYPHLVRSYLRQEEYSPAINYAEKYLRDYPQGAHSKNVYYLLVKSLRHADYSERASTLLHSPDRPVTRKLDSLAGKIFFSLERYGEAERYLARATGKRWEKGDTELLLLRAESLFHTGEYDQALTLYSHLEEEEYQLAQVRYRMGQIHQINGRGAQGAKLWQQIVDRKESPLWSELAREGLSINSLRKKDD